MFTPLVLGLCAYWVMHVGTPVVAVGEIAGRMCDARLIITDGGMGVYRTNDNVNHGISVRINADVAVVTIDGKEFTVPAGLPL
jgi:hypothetical protein